jgi:mono/diheme cytochrome c family protein
MSARALLLASISALAPAACGESAPKFHAPMKLGGVEVSADELNRGARVFALYCVSCHGEDGSGKGPAAASLVKPPRDFRAADFQYKSTPGDELPTDEDLDYTIRKGRVETGMPAWGGLTDADRHAVMQYLKTFSPRWQG